jgi:6-phosphogluconolactonase
VPDGPLRAGCRYTRCVTADEVAISVASSFAGAAATAIAARGRFLCAVPGGSVATRVFPRFADLQLDWRLVHVWLADERVVGPDDEQSNQRAVREHWLAGLAGSGPVFHSPHVEGQTPESAAILCADDLTTVAGVPPRLDVVLLGVGPDGHVASLFPSDPAWTTAHEWVIAVRKAPKPPSKRISLGLPTLAAAAEIWIVAFGAEKAAAIAEARVSPSSTLPVAVVARSGPAIRWFLDDGASGA